MREAITSLKARKQEGSLVVMPTDKSGKFSCMSLETYEAMGKEHTANDKVITEADLNEIQRDLNANARMLIKVFSVGSNHGEFNVTRVRSAFTTNASAPAVL